MIDCAAAAGTLAGVEGRMTKVMRRLGWRRTVRPGCLLVAIALVAGLAPPCNVIAEEGPVRDRCSTVVRELVSGSTAARMNARQSLLDLRAELEAAVPGAIAAATGDVSHGGALDSSAEVAGSFRLRAALPALVAALPIRLDKGTFPRGRRIKVERLYPAAQALVKMADAAVSSQVIDHVASSDDPALLRPAAWVLRELLGSDAAVAALEAEVGRRSDEPARRRLEACLALVGSAAILQW